MLLLSSSYPTQSHTSCRCQYPGTGSVYNQLNAGVRYLDMRTAMVEGDFYTCHSFLGPLLSDVLEQVAQFLAESPLEALILDFQHFYNVKDCHKQLCMLLEEKLGDALVSRDSWRLPLGNLLARGQRVFVFYNSVSQVWVWLERTEGGFLQLTFFPTRTPKVYCSETSFAIPRTRKYFWSPWADAQSFSVLKKRLDRYIEIHNKSREKLSVTGKVEMSRSSMSDLTSLSNAVKASVNENELEADIDDGDKESKAAVGEEHVFVLQAIITPDTDMVCGGVMASFACGLYGSRASTLFEISEGEKGVHGHLLKWLESSWADKHVNVIMTDHLTSPTEGEEHTAEHIRSGYKLIEHAIYRNIPEEMRPARNVDKATGLQGEDALLLSKGEHAGKGERVAKA